MGVTRNALKSFRYQLEAQSIDRRVIIKWILMKWDVDWIELAQDRVLWLAFVNTVMSFRVSYKARNLQTS